MSSRVHLGGKLAMLDIYVFKTFNIMGFYITPLMGRRSHTRTVELLK